MLVDPCLNAEMGLLREALSLTHKGKEEQLPSIFLGAAKGCALWGSLMKLVSTTTATPGSEPRNTMKTRTKPRDPPSAEANVVPLFILPARPEEGKITANPRGKKKQSQNCLSHQQLCQWTEARPSACSTPA